MPTNADLRDGTNDGMRPEKLGPVVEPVESVGYQNTGLGLSARGNAIGEIADKPCIGLWANRRGPVIFTSSRVDYVDCFRHGFRFPCLLVLTIEQVTSAIRQ